MTSENYRQLLNNEFNNKELTKEEFDNTLMHFAMLYHKEQLEVIKNDITKPRTFVFKHKYNSKICLVTEVSQKKAFKEAFKKLRVYGEDNEITLQGELKN